MTTLRLHLELLRRLARKRPIPPADLASRVEATERQVERLEELVHRLLDVSRIRAGGLEIETTSGEWIAAKPIPETFVINLGDLMARWTNGIYKSNLHRVKNNLGGSDRYSLPFFYSPRHDAVIDAIPTCITPEHPRLYPPCACADHMMEMFRRSYGYAPAA